MKMIRTLSNKDFGVDEQQEATFFREAARAVIFDEDNHVAVVKVEVGKYHKIPGGGIKTGEDHKKALKRECLEEAGVDIDIIGEVGQILEYRDDMKQYSYCYLAKLKGDKKQPKFTKSEIRDGFIAPDWLPIDEAIEIFERDEPEFLRAHFMRTRDQLFLEEARRLLSE